MPTEEPTTSHRLATGPGSPYDWSLRFPNRLEISHSIRAMVRSTCEARCMHEEDLEEILLVVTEIVNNSIEHVHGKGPGGFHEIDLQFGISGGTVVGRVVDEGEGNIGQGDFESAAAPDLDSDRGRGLFLIRAYVDELKVTALPGTGTEILFSKRVRIAAEGGKA